MINGDVKEFIDGLYYGDERFFIYDDNKYFVQGYCEAETFTSCILLKTRKMILNGMPVRKIGVIS